MTPTRMLSAPGIYLRCPAKSASQRFLHRPAQVRGTTPPTHHLHDPPTPTNHAIAPKKPAFMQCQFSQ